MFYKFRYKDGYEKQCSEQEAKILEQLKRGSIVKGVDFGKAETPSEFQLDSVEIVPRETKPRKRKNSDA